MSSIGSGINVVHVGMKLTPEDVNAIIDLYEDETKPDPLVAKQMRSWTLEWRPDTEKNEEPRQQLEESQNKTLKDGKKAIVAGVHSIVPSSKNTANGNDAEASSTYSLSGDLIWKGEHMVVALHSTCRWNRGNMSELNYTCQVASLDFRENVRSRIAQRLAQDDYIAKLLQGNSNKDSTKSKQSNGIPAPHLLCEAHIRDGEERFLTDSSVAEAIRRAVWSASVTTTSSASNESAPSMVLDVFEFLLQYMPLLPDPTLRSSSLLHTIEALAATAIETETKAADSLQSITSVLAERAKLRLLEDAMCDACENEAEEEMVEALSLQTGDAKPHHHKRSKRDS